MEGFSYQDIKNLAEMFKTGESSSDEDDLPTTGISKMGPQHIAMKAQLHSGSGDAAKSKETDCEETMWDEDEIPVGIRYDETEDPRERPEYEIVYKQAVTTEDMFLQMGLKTPATQSCENMTLVVSLVGEDYSLVDIEVQEQVVELRSPKYRLSLPLPHPVESAGTKVVWDPEKQSANITLQLKRELDFVNF